METKKLYKDDVYLRACSGKILDIKEGYLILDQTVFFPESGGQPCDLGTINGYNVVEVIEKNGEIFHKTLDVNTLSVGDVVSLKINWERRFLNMQRHCGEHILSGVFFQQLGAVNRGFHMGTEYMTIDMDIPDITWEQAMEAEMAANRVIWSNAPTITRTFLHREEAELLPLRKPLALDEDITIVCVGDVNNPSDCVACCGTHPSTAGQVGAVKIIKLESYKGMTRIYFKAGEEAYLDYRKKHDLVSTICKKYSATTEDLEEKISVSDSKNSMVRKNLYELKKVLIDKAIEEILSGDNNKFLIRFDYDYFSLEDLQTIGRQVTENIKGLLLLISKKDFTVMLFSKGNPDCGKLVRDNAEIYQGKGGGNPQNARAIFSKEEYIDTFIDLLEKHLR